MKSLLLHEWRGLSRGDKFVVLTFGGAIALGHVVFCRDVAGGAVKTAGAKSCSGASAGRAGSEKQPLSIGLLKCPRCGAALYEMPGDINWCRYFECRSCDAVFHFPPPRKRMRSRRRAASLKPKVTPPPIALVPGKRHRSELQEC